MMLLSLVTERIRRRILCFSSRCRSGLVPMLAAALFFAHATTSEQLCGAEAERITFSLVLHPLCLCFVRNLVPVASVSAPCS